MAQTRGKPAPVDPLDDLLNAVRGKLTQQTNREERAGGGDDPRRFGAEAMVREGKVWRDGIAPPSFPDFVKNELGGFLYPEQERAIMEALPADPALVFYPRPEDDDYYNDWPDGPPVRNPFEPLKALISTQIYLWGKGSGKDFVAAYIFSYAIYILLHLDDPWGYFHHGLGEPFDIINCAINAHQAQNVFFNKLKNCLRRECFAKFLDPNDIKMDSIKFMRAVPGSRHPVEFVRCWSRHSKSESIEGMNVILFILDEASGFELKGQKELAEDDEGEEFALSPADAIFDVLQSSASTRFEGQYLGVVISYPRHEDDFTMRKHRQADIERLDNYFSEEDLENPGDPVERRRIGKLKSPFLYAHKAPTWEINLRKPKKSFDKYFRQNPEKARMMYACEPPPAKGGYFSQPQKIDEAFDKKARPVLLWHPYDVIHNSQTFRAVELQGHRFSPANLYVAHCDPGHTSDAFTMAIAHPNWAVAEQFADSRGREFALPQVVIDALIVWRPDVRAGKVVDFINAGQTILDLAAICDLRRWTADKWNSVSIQQQLERTGTHAEFAAFSNADQYKQYENFKMLLYAGLIRFAGDWQTDDYWKRLREELRKLSYTPPNRIDHQTGASKDCADAVVGAVWLACQKNLGLRAFEGFQAGSHQEALAHQGNHPTSTIDALARLNAAPTHQALMHGTAGGPFHLPFHARPYAKTKTP